jgi:lipopolysaccharide export system protein LptC
MSSSPVTMRRPIELSAPSEVPLPPRPPRRRRHGRLARFARIALPLAALGLAGLIFAWSRINPIIERIHISDTEQAPEEIETVTMENARFAGVDAQNRTFNITAVRAVQSGDDSNHIDLKQPRADIVLSTGAKVALRSEAGGLQRDTKILELIGGVTLTQDQDYEFHTTKARIDLGQRTAAGDAPVDGRGPQGEIHAEGFDILDGGTRVLFRGHSRALLQQHQESVTP